MTFADVPDIQAVAEGPVDGDRAQYHLGAVSARLRRLLPGLEARAAEDRDVELLARDVIVQAVIRRLGGTSQQVRSESEGVGPFSRTLTYTVDKSGMFPDEDLALLGGGAAASGTVGTIRLPRPDWHAWGRV